MLWYWAKAHEHLMAYDICMNEPIVFNLFVDIDRYLFCAQQPSDLRKHRRKVHTAMLVLADFECDIIEPHIHF